MFEPYTPEPYSDFTEPAARAAGGVLSHVPKCGGLHSHAIP